MSKNLTNLHIPPEKQMSAIFDLLIENLAATFALQEFIFMKLMNMSGDNREQVNNKLDDFLKHQKEQIESLHLEITASVMSKYTT